MTEHTHIYFLATPHACGFLIPPPEIEPTTTTPQNGKAVLTTGPPGKSLCAVFHIIRYVLKSIIPTFNVLKYEQGIICSVISYQTPTPSVVLHPQHISVSDVASDCHTGQHRLGEGPPPTPTPMLDGLSSNCRVKSEILQKTLNGEWDVFSCRARLQDSDR